MQQVQGVHVVYHKTLSREDIITQSNHNVCSMLHTTGYLIRLILVLGVIFGIRPTAMVKLTLNRFYYDGLNNRKVIIFTENVGSCTGASKINAGGKAAIIKSFGSNFCF